MKLINSELYAALVESGASEEKAKAAAESVAEQQEQFHTIDKKLDRISLFLWVVFAAIVLPSLKVLFV